MFLQFPCRVPKSDAFLQPRLEQDSSAHQTREVFLSILDRLYTLQRPAHREKVEQDR